MKHTINYYKNLCRKLESELTLLEAVMSKAKRVGKKYPNRVRQAELVQGMKADESEQTKQAYHSGAKRMEKLSKEVFASSPDISQQLLDVATALYGKRDTEYETKEKLFTKNLDALERIRQALNAK